LEIPFPGNGDRSRQGLGSNWSCGVRKVNMTVVLDADGADEWTAADIAPYTISLAFLAPDLVKPAIAARLPHRMAVVRLPTLPRPLAPPAPDAWASSAIARSLASHATNAIVSWAAPPSRSITCQLPLLRRSDVLTKLGRSADRD